MNTTLEVAETIVSFFNASQNVDRDEFAIFVSYVLSEHGGIQAVEWIPRVTALERAGHEQLARSEGLGQYRITERDGGGALVIAADRPEYFPVYYLEPLVGNEAALGFDLASSPTRLAALEKARDTGTVVASAKISLVQGGGARPGVLIFAPIYRTGTPTQSVENRRESLEGYALAVLDIERTLANAINFSEAVAGLALMSLFSIFQLPNATSWSMRFRRTLARRRPPARLCNRESILGSKSWLETGLGW